MISKHHLTSPSTWIRTAVGSIAIFVAFKPSVYLFETYTTGLYETFGGPGSIAYLFAAFIVGACCYLIYLSFVNRQMAWIPYWVTVGLYIAVLTLSPLFQSNWDERLFTSRVESIVFKVALSLFGALNIISIPFLLDPPKR